MAQTEKTIRDWNTAKAEKQSVPTVNKNGDRQYVALAVYKTGSNNEHDKFIFSKYLNGFAFRNVPDVS